MTVNAGESAKAGPNIWFLGSSYWSFLGFERLHLLRLLCRVSASLTYSTAPLPPPVLLTVFLVSDYRPWWSKNTVAVVTGANKGVGYEIARGLAEQGLTVVLTARDQARGQAALDALTKAGQESVCFHQLEVTSSESVQTLATWLKSKFGGIDVLINNAGLAYGPKPGDSVDYENAKAIIDTNYFGVKYVTEGLLPLLRPSPASARIVNVTAQLGLYERLRSETVKETFRDVGSYTVELIDSLARKYLEDVKEDRWDGEGWIGGEGKTFPMYSESKMFLNAYSILLARSLAKSQPEGHQILLVTFTPGVTATDNWTRSIKEGHPLPPDFKPNSPAEGADTGVWLALLPKEDLIKRHGKFFKDRKEYAVGSSASQVLHSWFGKTDQKK